MHNVDLIPFVVLWGLVTYALTPGKDITMSKYPADTRKAVLAAIAGGMSLRKAARRFGVPLGTVNGWWRASKAL